jgi:hypothetical protein
MNLKLGDERIQVLHTEESTGSTESKQTELFF